MAYVFSLFYWRGSIESARAGVLGQTQLLVRVIERVGASSGRGFNYTLQPEGFSGFRLSLFGYQRLEQDSIYCIKKHNLDLKIEDDFRSLRDSVLARGFFKYANFRENGPPRLGRKFELMAQKNLSPLAAELYQSIFLGCRCLASAGPIREIFLHAGMSHFLARSGLHVVIVSWIVGLVLGFFLVPWFWAIFLQILFLTFYTAVSWGSVSFFRALLMIVIFKLSAITGRNLSSWDIFKFVFFVTTLANPFQFFCLDFQLSFAITGALILFAGKTRSL